MRWTKRQDELLERYVKEGMSVKWISDNIHRTECAIRKRLSDKNILLRGYRWTSKQHEEILQAYRDGVPLKVIAHNMNTTHANIRMMIYNARKKGLIGYRYNVRSVSGSQCQN